MKPLRIIPIALAALLLLGLLAACGGQTDPTTTGETTAEHIVTTIEETPTENEPDPTKKASNELLDFALIDRLFAMTYADYCAEEGQTVEPEGYFEGSVYCKFSKYGNDIMFFFDPDWDAEEPTVKNPDKTKPGAVFFPASDILSGRQALTLGELKNWLDEKTITYGIDDEQWLCFFTIGEYDYCAVLDGVDDSEAVKRIEVHCDSNFS